MRFVVRTLMFLACLMYGTMPGMAMVSVAGPMTGMQVGDKIESSSGKHTSHTMSMASDEANNADPCPHKDSMTHAPFCAACLVLLPELTFAEKGQAPHAAPLPDLQRAFIGNLPVPPLPPPRA